MEINKIKCMLGFHDFEIIRNEPYDKKLEKEFKEIKFKRICKMWDKGWREGCWDSPNDVMIPSFEMRGGFCSYRIYNQICLNCGKLKLDYDKTLLKAIKNIEREFKAEKIKMTQKSKIRETDTISKIVCD